MTPPQESYSRSQPPTLFDTAFDRLGSAEGYTTTARRSVARLPATNPRARQLRKQAEDHIAAALDHIKTAVDRLVDLEQGG